MGDNGTAKTAEQLLDELAISGLLARLAQLADRGDLDEYISHFTENATWELANAYGLPLEEQIRRGHPDILAGVRERREAGVQGPGTATKHDISSVVVTVDGDRAGASTYFRYYEHTDRSPVLTAIGRYEDEFVRSPQGWLLARRVIHRD